jgi:hypothetical protein
MRRIILVLSAIAGTVGLVQLAGVASNLNSDQPIVLAPSESKPYTPPTSPAPTPDLKLDAVATQPTAKVTDIDPKVDTVPEPVPSVVLIPDKGVTNPAPAPSNGPAATEFAGFPLNTLRVVNFRMDEGMRQRLSPRAQADQLRDWLLITSVSDAGLSVSQRNQALFDVPTVRHGYMRATANFEYGLSRSCALGDDRVLALAPKCPEAEQKDHLARVADEYRKNTGHKPAELIVFEYELDANRVSASVTRRPSVDGADLFQAAYGYHEMAVTDTGKLAEFLATAPNLTFATKEGQGLRVGGRQRLASTVRGIGAEDVAAVWKAQLALTREREAFEAKWKEEEAKFNARWKQEDVDFKDRQTKAFDDLRKEYIRKAKEADLQDQVLDPERPENVLPGRPRNPRRPLVPKPGESDLDQSVLRELLRQQGQLRFPAPEQDMIAVTDDLKRDFEKDVARLKEKFKAESKKLEERAKMEGEEFNKRYNEDPAAQRALHGTGFSLDPTYDFESLAAKFERLAPRLQEEANGSKDRDRQDRVVAVTQALMLRNEIPLFQLIEEIKKDGTPAASRLAVDLVRALSDCQFQKARYDGDLASTEVGMVLFYTDLLAKLWAIDFSYGTPRGIEDFTAMANASISPIFAKEADRLSHTRLWFGPQDKGFQVAEGRRTLIFSHVATRIFALSRSDTTRNESQANARSEAFLGWWNDHYEEVAAFEPQYERLNAIMKWSLVASWLAETKGLDQLNILGDVNVDRKAWFPDWCKSGREKLRFTRWGDVRFHERGYKGTSTEAMEMLSSPLLARYPLRGGVSLANVEVIKKHDALPQIRPGDSLILRGNLDLKAFERGSDRISTLDGIDHTLLGKNGRGAQGVRSHVTAGVKLRGTSEELANGRAGDDGDGPPGVTFTRTWEPDEGPRRSIVASVELGGASTGLGKLRIEGVRNGFDVDFQSHDIDKGHSLARRLSTASNLATALAAEPGVASFFSQGDESFWVRLHGCEKWLKLAPNKGNEANISKGWHSRSADTRGGATPLDLAWFDNAEAARALGKGEWVAIDMPATADQRPLIDTPARGPPEMSKELKINAGGGAGRNGGDPPSFTGFADPENPRRFFVRTQDLPKDPQTALVVLATVFHGANGEGVKNAVHDGKAVYTVPTPPPTGPVDVISAMRNGRAGEAARLIAADPANARRLLDWHLTDGTRRADLFFKAGRPAEALEVLSELQQVHGDHPVVLAEIGAAEILIGRPARAAEVLNELRPRTSTEADRVLDEINVRLGASHLTEHHRANLLRGARFVDYGKHHRDQGPDSGMALVAGPGGRLLLEGRFQATEMKPQREIGAFEQSNPPLLLYDEPAASRDWSPIGGLATLRGLIDGGTADLFALQASSAVTKELAHYRPDAVTFQKGSDPALLGPNGEPRRFLAAPFTLPNPPAGKYVPYNPDGGAADVRLLRLKAESPGK